ncbi:hypothetical protein FRX31_030531, partial [Thalictrum thalictroides]
SYSDVWSLVKSADDMKRWMEGISKGASLNHMLQILLKMPPSTRTLEHTGITMEIKDELHPDRQERANYHLVERVGESHVGDGLKNSIKIVKLALLFMNPKFMEETETNK